MKKLLPIILSVFVMTVNMLCADASENILRGVDVVKSGNTYKIELTSSEPAQMTKTNLSANRVILNLKNISLSGNISSSFEGHHSLENIVIESYGKNGVNIMLQGDNIAYSNIEFKSPTAVESVQDSVKSSFSSLFDMLTGSSAQNRTFQAGILAVLLFILVSEIRFVKSKYSELQAEKLEMMRNIEATSDFKDYLPSKAKTALHKPYTTPIYLNGVNTNIPMKNRLSQLRTPETVTLNSLLSNRNNENKIIDRIVNNTPVFGALSANTTTSVSNPIEKSQLNTNIKYLENLTAKYKAEAALQDLNLQKRLNRIY